MNVLCQNVNSLTPSNKQAKYTNPSAATRTEENKQTLKDPHSPSTAHQPLTNQLLEAVLSKPPKMRRGKKIIIRLRLTAGTQMDF